MEITDVKVIPVDDEKLENVWRNRQIRRKARPVGELLDIAEDLLRGGGEGVERVALLAHMWRSIVPEELADSVRPVAFSKGVIRLVADDSATQFEVQRELGMALVRAAQQEFPQWGVRRMNVVLAGIDR